MAFDGIAIEAIRGQLDGLAGNCAGIDLILQQLINETTDALAAREKIAIQLTTLVSPTAKLIKSLPVGAILDSDGSIGNRFQTCIEGLARNIVHYTAKKAAIDHDCRLDPHEDKREHLHKCYEKLLDAWSFLHASLVELRDAIAQYDGKAPKLDYPKDDGPLTKKNYKAIRSRVKQGQMVVTDSILG